MKIVRLKLKFNQFECVRQSGRFNMHEPMARYQTILSKAEWDYIMRNYSKLSKKYGGDHREAA